MIRLNIHEAKTHLSRYLAKLRKGERIVLCRRNQPIAEIIALPTPVTRKRPLGLAKGRLTVPSAFWEPLPDDLTRAFEGQAP
jgi:antitoxin (DNA-binding transcriptional repressor) of toxin-antitoxin stability system